MPDNADVRANGAVRLILDSARPGFGRLMHIAAGAVNNKFRQADAQLLKDCAIGSSKVGLL